MGEEDGLRVGEEGGGGGRWVVVVGPAEGAKEGGAEWAAEEVKLETMLEAEGALKEGGFSFFWPVEECLKARSWLNLAALGSNLGLGTNFCLTFFDFGTASKNLSGFKEL